MESLPEKRKIWSGEWGYRESFTLIAGLFFAGICLGYFLDKEIASIQWPFNLISGLVLIFFIAIFGTVFRKSNVFKWFSGKKNAICSISFYLVIIILLGLIPQKTEYSRAFFYRLGFSHILSSHFFLFAHMHLLFTLGMVIARRFNKFNLRNIAFFINHFGLWLTLFSIGFGAGDLKKVRMEINKTNPIFEGVYDNGKQTGDLGLAIQLEEFDIEYYSPKAFIIDATTGDILYEKEYLSLQENEEGKIGDWTVSVSTFLEYSVGIKNKFYPVYEIGAAPAAYVSVISNENEKTEAWISCGSFRYPGNFLEISNNKLLVMADPEAKSYKSKIKIYTEEGDVFTADLTVGSPVSVKGWKIYQTSYDSEKGRWSEISIIELVKDPWLWVVYCGLILMIIGSIYLIATGKRTKK